MVAQHSLQTEPQKSSLDGARDEVINDFLCQTVDPLRGDSVRNQDNGEAPAGSLGARGGQQLADAHGRLHARQVDVNHGQRGRIGRGERGQSGFSGKKDFHARSVCGEQRLDGGQQRGLGGPEKKEGSGVGKHPDTTSIMDASAMVRKYLESG